MTMKPKQLLAAIALAVAAMPATAADLLGIYRDALVSDNYTSGAVLGFEIRF